MTTTIWRFVFDNLTVEFIWLRTNWLNRESNWWTQHSQVTEGRAWSILSYQECDESDSTALSVTISLAASATAFPSPSWLGCCAGSSWPRINEWLTGTGSQRVGWKRRSQMAPIKVNILRLLVRLLMALIPHYGPGRPHERTPPSLGRPRGHLNGSAEFLAVALRRLLETIGSQGEWEMAIPLSPPCLPSRFLRRPCVAAAQQQHHQQQHQQKAPGRPLPRYLLERVLVCVLHTPPLLDLMLTSLCFREHVAAKRIRLFKDFLLARRAWLVYSAAKERRLPTNL